MTWVNTFPEKPVNITHYEDIEADKVGMALSLIQGAYIVEEDIIGGYTGEIQFKIIYRVKPSNDNDRLEATELLNRFGDWSLQQKPDIGEGQKTLEIEPTTRAALFAKFENGDEDYQIFLVMRYKVSAKF